MNEIQIPFVPVKPIRGGRPMDKLYNQLAADPAWVCQAKLNGKRAIWDGEYLWSRTGNRITPFQAGKALAALAIVPTCLDGELVKDVFYAFDLPDHEGPLHERWALLKTIIPYDFEHFKICPSGVSWEDVSEHKWEGVVFKRLNSKYEKAMSEGKTTPAWVKYRAEWL